MAELQLLIKCGKDMGLEGVELQKWVEQKEKEKTRKKEEKVRRE